MDNHNVKVMAQFDKCPHCGGKRRAGETVAVEQQQKGLLRDDFDFVLLRTGGPVFDPSRLGRMLVGQKVAAVVAFVDACLDCGALYAVKVERQEVPIMTGLLQPLPAPGFSSQ